MSAPSPLGAALVDALHATARQAQARPRETPERRRRRLMLYRLVYLERWGQVPEELNECKERL